MKELFGLVSALGASSSASALSTATVMALGATTANVLKYTAAAAVGGAVIGAPMYLWGKRRERNSAYDLALASAGLVHKDQAGCLTRAEAADAEVEHLAALAAQGTKAVGGQLIPQAFVRGEPVPVVADDIEALRAEIAALKAAQTHQKKQ